MPNVGDDALAAGMALVDGSTTLNSDVDLELNRTRDYIAQRTSSVTPVPKGGTGSTSAPGARANLDVPSNADLTNGLATRVRNNSNPTNAIALEWTGTRLKAVIDGSDQGGLAKITEVLPIAGGTLTGDLKIPGATGAVSGYTVAYIDGDGTLRKGVSSERFKEDISAVDPATLGELFPGIYRWRMIDGDGSWRFGWIAERLADSAALRPFVVYDEAGQVESIDFIALLIMQTANLHLRVLALEHRVAAHEFIADGLPKSDLCAVCARSLADGDHLTGGA